MTRRRWTDPRDHRTWEVTACSVRDPAAGAGSRPGRELCFDSVATPRRGYSVACGPRLEGHLRGLDDQALALCLDAARSGGFLRLDESGDVRWIRRGEGTLLVRSCAGDVELRPAPHLPWEIDHPALLDLLEGREPAPPARTGRERLKTLA